MKTNSAKILSILLILFFVSSNLSIAVEMGDYNTSFEKDESKVEGKINKEVKTPSVNIFPSLIPSLPIPSFDFLRQKKGSEEIVEEVEINTFEEEQETEKEPVITKKIRTYNDYKMGLFDKEAEPKEETASVEQAQPIQEVAEVEEAVDSSLTTIKEDNKIVEVRQEKGSVTETEIIPAPPVPASESEKDIITLEEPDDEKVEIAIEKKEGKLRRFWRWFKGKPVENNVQLGMFSKHFFTNTAYNEENHLIAMDLKGFTGGYLINSYDHDTFFAGVSRYVNRKQFGEHFSVDLRYIAAIMHGYKDKYPNIEGYTPLILPKLGFTYRKVGFDLWMIPSDTPIFCINSRINLPDFKKKKEKI